MTIEHFENLVIGSGEAGKYFAWTFAKRGQKTIVVERKMLGGACPNVACLPSKNVIYSAKAVSLVDPDSGLGVVTGSRKVDMAGVFRRKEKMIDGLMRLHRDKFTESGAELLMGSARFTEPKTVEVILNDGGTRQLRGDRVILCLGSRASLPNVPGLIEARPLTHVEALDLKELPSHLVILGGGYIGLEFAQAMRRFGSRVTIVQRSARLLDREDPEVSDAILELMHHEGIEVLLDTDVLLVSGLSGEGVRLQLRSGGTTTSVDATHLLAAAGRTPNTDTVDVAKAGVELDARGFIRVNEKLETTAPDVWAVGDCAGSPQFTHAAFDDFRVIRDNLSGGSRTTRGRLIPYVLFTDPELAHVGMSESDAKTKGVHYRLVRIPMAAVLRTRTLSETRGFAKALIADDDRILGFTAFGAEASEMMAVVQTAILGALPYTVLRDAIFTHPTTSEGLTSLFASVPPLVS